MSFRDKALKVQIDWKFQKFFQIHFKKFNKKIDFLKVASLGNPLTLETLMIDVCRTVRLLIEPNPVCVLPVQHHN